jgi:hypothetical protein
LFQYLPFSRHVASHRSVFEVGAGARRLGMIDFSSKTNTGFRLVFEQKGVVTNLNSQATQACPDAEMTGGPRNKSINESIQFFGLDLICPTTTSRRFSETLFQYCLTTETYKTTN